MQMELVLTVMAKDRPGIVELLADVVTSYDGNWVDSAMSRLGGEFAGILRVTLDEDKAPGLEKALDALHEDGISISMRETSATSFSEQAETGRKAYFEVTGQDHKGIVRDVSRVLADNKVNVDELRTHIFEGSMTGEHMFSAEADIVLPDGLEMDQLCEKLEDLASDLMVEVKMCSVKEK
ncbi:MAG: amino acid-binding protein [bacterium]|nr:amino acid-binding protein [bacterium]